VEIADCVVRATFAKLVDHFHLRPWDIARLTDRQIVELYFHPRNDEHEIEPVPEPPKVTKEEEKKGPTLKRELFEIDMLVFGQIMSAADGFRTKAKVRAKYAGQPIPKDDEIELPEELKAQVIRGEKLK